MIVMQSPNFSIDSAKKMECNFTSGNSYKEECFYAET